MSQKVTNWETSQEIIFGDHRLISIKLTHTIPIIEKRRYKTKYQPLNQLSQAIINQLNENNISFKNLLSPSQFDTEYTKFLDILYKNYDQKLKKKAVNLTPKIYWWSPELRSLRNKVTALHRKLKNSPSQLLSLQYKSERSKYKKSILMAKRQAWQDFCTKTTNPFGKLKDLAFGRLQDFNLYKLNDFDPSLPVSRHMVYWDITNKIFGKSASTLITRTQKSVTSNQTPFSESELKKAIFHFKINKSPGPDNIDHYQIRSLYNCNSSIFLNMYNSLLELNYFPVAWKRGELVFFRKEGRDPTLASSYRPITLLPILGKVFEKMLLRRIHHFLLNFNGLSQRQHGFQSLKSTESAINVALSFISLNRDKNNYTSFISLDFQGAFDNLPWNSTLNSLHRLNLPLQYFNIISSFLSQRCALVDWKNPSLVYNFSKGCPQGSCLGPFLWTILLDSLLTAFDSKDCNLVAYADDLLLISGGSSRRALEGNGNSGLALISAWAANEDITISIEKSKAITFGKPKILKRDPIFKLNNQSIPNTRVLKYLGIFINTTLSFLPHLREKRQQILKLIQNLYRFSSIQGGIPREIFKIWYKTILERQIAYAVGTWYRFMWPSHGKKLLLSIQRSALLLITRAYAQTSTVALQVVTGLPPIDLQLGGEAEFSSTSRLGVPVNDLDPILFSSKCNKNLIDPTKPLINIIDTANYSGSFRIYTDGSKTEKGVGMAFCVFQGDQLVHSWSAGLGVDNSVFQAELQAIKSAIFWYFESIPNEKALILSDSLSGLLSLQDMDSETVLVVDIISMLQAKSHDIKFTWIRGHTGESGNELADTLAKQATSSSQNFIFIPKPLSSLKYKLRNLLLLRWQSRWVGTDKGRYTYNFFPKISTKRLISNRYLVMFLSNHGPFQSYLFKIDKSNSPLCVCGETSDSLHYILSCPLTTSFHIRYSQSTQLHDWFNFILSRADLIARISACMSYVENNTFLFENTSLLDHHPLVPDDSDVEFQ